MGRTKGSGYDGLVSNEFKIADTVIDNKKLPNLKKAMRDASTLAEKASVMGKRAFGSPKAQPDIDLETLVEPDLEIDWDSLEKDIPKVSKTNLISKKGEVKKGEVKKGPHKKQKVLSPKKINISFEDLLGDLPSSQPVQEVTPKRVVGDKNILIEEPIIKQKESDTYSEDFISNKYIQKDLFLLKNLTSPEELDFIWKSRSRSILIERDHPIFTIILNALKDYSEGNVLELQPIVKDSIFSTLFEGVLQKVVSSLWARIIKIPMYGYLKFNIKHNFLIADFLYTRTHTSYYVLIDFAKTKIQRIILVNTDIIFT